MTASSSITAIWSGKRIEFGPGKMSTAGATMAASAKNSYLVNKIAFFHDKVVAANVMVIDLLRDLLIT